GRVERSAGSYQCGTPCITDRATAYRVATRGNPAIRDHYDVSAAWFQGAFDLICTCLVPGAALGHAHRVRVAGGRRRPRTRLPGRYHGSAPRAAPGDRTGIGGGVGGRTDSHAAAPRRPSRWCAV